MNFKNSSDATQEKWAPKSWFIAQFSEDENASGYFNHANNGYQNFRHKIILSQFSRSITNIRNVSLLDIGCASGALTDLFRRNYNFKHAVGVDFVPGVLKKGKIEYPDINFVEASLPGLPFKEKNFDLIIASEVLYYLTSIAQKNVLESIYNLLNSDGVLVVSSALGGDYFDLLSGRELLMQKYDIIGEYTLHMRCYHIFTSPFFYLIRVKELLSNDRLPASESMKSRYLKILPIIRFPIVKQMIYIFATLSKPIIANRLLPGIFNILCRWDKPSNVTFILKKKVK